MAVWKVSTGGIHLDGLADCLDGLAGVNAERRLAIMRDSRIGVFGALGLVLCLLIACAALSGIPAAARAPILLLAPAVGRLTPLLVGPRVRPATPGQGLGAAFLAALPRAAGPVWLAVLLVLAWLLLGPTGAAMAAGALVAGAGGSDRSRATPRRTDRRRPGGRRRAVRAGLARPRRFLRPPQPHLMRHHERSSTTVYLVRHGSVVGAETRRFIGHLDVPLSPLGERQIAAVAEHLSEAALDAVYSSDLLRTRRSAAIIASPHGLVPIERSALREFAMGRWEGLTGEEIRALDADAHSTWMADVAGYQFPDGENLAQLSARAWPAFEEIVGAHAGGALAIVAHGGTNRVLLCRALGVAPERILALGQDYAALSVLVWSRGRFTLARLNHQVALTGPSD